jgi:hypothetical protein
MVIEENFERSAYRLLEMVKDAQRRSPGAARTLWVEIHGHRNHLGGFDHDAFEIIAHFVPVFLSPYFTEYRTPWHLAKNTKKQRNDIPSELIISSLPGEETSYDVESLAPRFREIQPEPRSSPPSVKAISEYIGILPPRCLICKKTPVERTHAVPKSLGGSYDVRNFALLCSDHHRQAPDIADAEAFWAWVDYMVMRHPSEMLDGVRILTGVPPNHPKMLGVVLPIKGIPDDQKAIFGEALYRELVELYGWSEEEFASVTWKVSVDLYKVLETATGYHFGINRKPSTYAWAYDVALRRTGKKRPPYFPIY